VLPRRLAPSRVSAKQRADCFPGSSRRSCNAGLWSFPPMAPNGVLLSRRDGGPRCPKSATQGRAPHIGPAGRASMMGETADVTSGRSRPHLRSRTSTLRTVSEHLGMVIAPPMGRRDPAHSCPRSPASDMGISLPLRKRTLRRWRSTPRRQHGERRRSSAPCSTTRRVRTVVLVRAQSPKRVPEGPSSVPSSEATPQGAEGSFTLIWRPLLAADCRMTVRAKPRGGE